mgnify:CR=1 FL=1
MYLEEGTAGEGRGFVLMPSACPYGRHISADVMANYETMVRLATGFKPNQVKIPKRFLEGTTWKGITEPAYLGELTRTYARRLMKMGKTPPVTGEDGPP